MDSTAPTTDGPPPKQSYTIGELRSSTEQIVDQLVEHQCPTLITDGGRFIASIHPIVGNVVVGSELLELFGQTSGSTTGTPSQSDAE